MHVIEYILTAEMRLVFVCQSVYHRLCICLKSESYRKCL